MDWLTRTLYQPLLNLTLRWRYVTFGLSVCALLVMLSQLTSGRIPIQWLSNIEANVVTATVTATPENPAGSLLMSTRKLEQAALRVQQQLLEESGGDTPQILAVRAHLPPDGLVATVYLSLTSGRDRFYSGQQIIDHWRDALPTLSNDQVVVFSSAFNTSSQGFWLQLTSNDRAVLQHTASQLTDWLAGIEGISAPLNTLVAGVPEIALGASAFAQSQGIDPTLLEHQLKHAIKGIDLPDLQLSAPISEQYSAGLPVTLKLASASPEQLQELPLHIKTAVTEKHRTTVTDLPATLPLFAVARLSTAADSQQQTRLNGQYVAWVTATVDPTHVNVEKLYQQAHQQLEAIDRGSAGADDVQWQISGIKGSQIALSQRLLAGFWLALAAIFILMAASLRSLRQPLLVLSAVPFGWFGAVLGHALMGFSITVWSLAGMVAVSGIVINDNLVLVDTINRLRQQGQSVANAVMQAGSLRLRPILLTSLTTFIGLLPMMTDRSWEAQFLVPMAIATGFGVLIATLVSLLLVPAMVLIGDDGTRKIHGRPSNR